MGSRDKGLRMKRQTMYSIDADWNCIRRTLKKQLRADILANACPALFGGRECWSGMPASLAAASCCRPMVELYENRRGV